jgi:hypothetical protein
MTNDQHAFFLPSNASEAVNIPVTMSLAVANKIAPVKTMGAREAPGITAEPPTALSVLLLPADAAHVWRPSARPARAPPKRGQDDVLCRSRSALHNVTASPTGT